MSGRSGHKFFFSGWGERQPVEIWLPQDLGLATWRKIVDNALRLLEPELVRLDAALPPKLAAKAAYIESKERRHFELSIAPSKRMVAALPAPRPFASRWGPTATTGLSQGQEALTSALLSAVLIGATTTEELPSWFHAQQYRRLSSGEGRYVPALFALEDRYRPAIDSLAGWLAMTSEQARAKVTTYVLLPDSQPSDVELLRSRVYPHQLILARAASPAAARLLAVWDGASATVDEWHIFSSPGPIFVEPRSLLQPPFLNGWPKISVVTVSFNQAPFLEECLKSILGQGYPNLEYIVIDACSSDGSQDILKRYKDRIDHLVIEPDSGQSEGLQKGLDLATGEILTWINSDDMLAPNSLKRAALAYLQFGSDLVAGTCARVGEDSSELYLHHAALPTNKAIWLDPMPVLAWQHGWERGDYFFQPEVFFSRDIWRRTGAFIKPHLHWAMDWDLWVRCALAGASVVRIPDILGVSRVQANQKTQDDRLYLHQISNILAEYHDLLLEAESALPALAPGPEIALPSIHVAAPVRRRHGLLKRLKRFRKGMKARRRDLISRARALLSERAASWLDWPPVPPGLVTSNTHQELSSIHQALQHHHDLLKSRYEEQQTQIEVACTRVKSLEADLSKLLGYIHANSPTSRELSLRTEFSDISDANLLLSRLSEACKAALAKLSLPLSSLTSSKLPSSARQQMGTVHVLEVGPRTEGVACYAGLYQQARCIVVHLDPLAKADVASSLPPHGPGSKWDVLPYAAGDGQPGRLHIWTRETTGAMLVPNATLVEPFDQDNLREASAPPEVKTYRLDDLVRLGAIAPSIDFLKINRLGTSFEILSNSADLLSKTLVVQVTVELVPLHVRQRLFIDVDLLLEEAGFRLLDLLPTEHAAYAEVATRNYAPPGQLLRCEAVYVRSLDDLGRLADTELLKLAVIMNDVYGKEDAVGHFLALYESRQNARRTEQGKAEV